MIKIIEKEDVYFCEICGEEFFKSDAESYGYKCPRCREELILDGNGEILCVDDELNGDN